MSWSVVRGQPLAIRMLRQAVAAKKVAHAYLFVGPQGVGKRLTARELAKSLTCLQPQPDGSACDTCRSCRKVAAEPPVHPDLLLVEPEGRFIRTEQMRSLQAEIYARPTEGRARIAIIDGAERLNVESGNRVLKVLEEPPPYATFILLTHNIAGILPTIISRCQVINFPPLATDDVSQILQEKAGLPMADAHLFASLSGGSVGLALDLANNPEVLERRNEALDLLLGLAEMDDVALLGKAEAYEKQKESLEQQLEMLTVWLRDALLLSQGAPEHLVINADRLSEARRLAIRYGPNPLLAMLEAVSAVRGQFTRNANPRLALDVMLLSLHRAATA